MIPKEKFFFLPSFQASKNFFTYEDSLKFFDHVISKRVSEQYHASAYHSDDEDLSDFDSDSEELISDSLPQQEFNLSDVLEYATKKKNNHYEFMFGSFNSDIVPIKTIKIIKPKIDGSTFKVGEITCFFNVEGPTVKVKEGAQNEPIADLNSSATFDLVSNSTGFDRRHAILAVADSNRIVSALAPANCASCTVNLPKSPSSWLGGEQKRQILAIENRISIKLALILSCLDSESRISVAAVESFCAFSGLHSVEIAVFDLGGIDTILSCLLLPENMDKNTDLISAKHRSDFVFDPGGALTHIVISVALEHSRSYAYLSFQSHLRLVFDPGRIAINRHGSCCYATFLPLISLSSSLSRNFQKLPLIGYALFSDVRR